MWRFFTIVHKGVALSLALILMLAQPGFAYAGTGAPRILNYQGRLMDGSGTLLGGTGTAYCFKFSIYGDATVGSGTKLWPSSAPSTMTATVKNGVFSVGIGDTNAGGDLLDFDFQSIDTAYLNVEVATKVGATCAPGDGAESFETLSPRNRIDSSGYAINANTVGGFSPSQEATANEIPALAGGRLVLGSSAAGIGATTTNEFTIQGDSTGNINFFNTNNRLTSGGDLTLQGLLTTDRLVFVSGTSTNFFSAFIAASAAAFGATATSSFDTAGQLILAGGFNGPLQANNGLVSATSSVGVLYGGTGIGIAPAYGEVLLGNGTGGYTLTSTSSLGISAGTSFGQSFEIDTTGYLAPTTTQTIRANGGFVSQASSTVIGDFTATGQTNLGYASSTGISSSYASSTRGFFGSLSIGSLSGILKATAGAISTSLVSLTSDVSGILGITNGGTGTSTAPSYGQLLVGNAAGGYDLVGTSSLGFISSVSWGQIGGLLASQTDLQTALDAKLALSDWYATTTDGLDEGLSNLYFTTARADSNFADNLAATTTTALAEGSNLYYTDTRATDNFVANLAATTSVSSITTLPSLTLPALQLTGFGVPFYTFFNSTTTDALAEGSTNLYFTQDRVAGVLSGTTTDALAEGPTNLYYTAARATNSFIQNLAGTSTVYSLTTLPNLAITASQVSDFAAAAASAADAYIAASTTIPKTYADNTFDGTQTFANASTTNLSAEYASSTIANFGSVSITGLSGVVKASGGTLYSGVVNLASEVTGILPIANGGIGTSTAPTTGTLLVGNEAGGFDYLSTSTLGLSSSDITEGTNLFYQDSRVNTYLNSSTTLAKAYTANTFTNTNTFDGQTNLAYASSTGISSSYASSTSGFFGSLSVGTLTGLLRATAGTIATGFVNLASEVSGILSVANGGTGWAAIQAGSIPYGNGTGALATTSAGTAGQVLALLNGVPTWTSTTTFGYPLQYAAGNVTLAFGTTTNNAWSGANSFAGQTTLAQASSTAQSTLDYIAVGRTATTTIRGETNATSTFAGGIDLSHGCLAINGNCIGAGGGGGGSGTLVNIQVFSTAGTTTYTPSAGATVAYVVVTGGGGGGGAANGPSADTTNETIGGAGGAGGTSIGIIDLTATTSVQVVVGAGGAGGTAGTATANAGAGGSYSYIGTYASSTGGTGGGGAAVNATGCGTNGAIGAAGTGGTGALGSINLNGGTGLSGSCAAESVVGGAGGSSYWGAGGAGAPDPAANGSSAGVSATTFGAGGGGAASEDSSGTGAAGGNGAAGAVVVYEYGPFTGIMSIANGGTGKSVGPSYGQLLMGNSSGGYDLVATSSLGIAGGGGSWGTITGTLSDQTDLQAALDAKLSFTEWYSTTTDQLQEGSTNLYFTTARALSNFISNLAATTSVSSITALPNLSLSALQLTGFGAPFYDFFSATTTDALAEGSTNLYFTQDRVAGVLSGTTTDALAEGADNLYFTAARVDAIRDFSIQFGALAPTTTLGILVSASSTIGDGSDAGGLTIAGTATTTGNAFIGGILNIATTTMRGLLSIGAAKPIDIGSGDGTDAATALAVVGAAGGDTTDTGSAIGGNGGGSSLVAGDGGIASGATVSATGGNGGSLTFTAGNGAAQTANGISRTGGSGGNIVLNPGSGGSASGGVINTQGIDGAILLAPNGGKVGVGTTSPIALFAVGGAGYFDSLSIGLLSGVVRATAGSLTAGLLDLGTDVTGTLGVGNGGTGLSSTPTYGQVLVGDGAGGYTLVATSSLGIVGGGGGPSPLTTKGDLYTYSTTDTRLPVGADGEFLVADSSSATGLAWKTVPMGDMAAATFYDATGGVTLTSAGFVAVPLDTTLVNNATGVYSLASGEVTVAETGYYLITYEVTGRLAAGTRSGLEARLQIDGGSGYADVSGSGGFSYGRLTTETSGTSAGTVVQQLTAGDKVRIAASGTTQDFTSQADGTRLSLVQLKAPGGTGGTPAGSTGQLQFNAAGAFTADATLSFDSTTKSLAFSNGSTTDITIAGRIFDNADSAGFSGDILQSTGSGFQWVSPTSLGGTPFPGNATTTNLAFNGGLSTTYASTTGISAEYASSTAGFFGSLSVGNLTGVLKAFGGVVYTGLVNVESDITGILPIANGGTGTSTAPATGQVLVGNALGGYDLIATSSLGLASSWGTLTGTLSNQTDLQAAFDEKLNLVDWYSTTTDQLQEGSGNLFFTAQRADDRISATSSIGTLTAATALGTVSTSLSGLLRASAGVLSTTLVNLASEVTGVLAVANGGTGWANIQAGTLLTGNGSGQIATTTIGSTLQISGSTLGLNLSSANVWNGLQRFVGNASSTAFSALDAVQVGRTATTTIRGEANATSTFAGGVQANAFAAATNATSTFGGIQAEGLTVTTSTSTFGHGINVTGGCIAYNGQCIATKGIDGVTVTTFTANGTWTKSNYSGLSFTQVIVTGGGGGGGGADGTDTTNETSGAGGGAGGTAIKMIASGSLNTAETVTVGGGGAGGLNTGTNGSTGVSSAFGTHSSATGGTGGGGTGTLNATGCAANGGFGGNTNAGTGGVGSGGDINLNGGAGNVGACAAEAVVGGTGGASYWGGGGSGGNDPNGNLSNAGADGAAYGSGGGGAADEDSTTGAAGGVGGSGVVLTMNYTSSGGDLAEWYETEGDVEATDIVAIGGDSYEYDSKLGLQSSSIMKKASAGDAVVGVVSSAPYQTIGLDALGKAQHPRPIALAGRVPVKVSDENGAVHSGDLVTLSSQPGIAMRSTKAGVTVGRAIDDMRCDETNACTVLIMVNTVYSTGALTKVALRDAGIDMDAIPAGIDVGRVILASKLQQKQDITASTTLSEVNTDRVVAGLEVITPRVVTKTLVVDGIEPLDRDIALHIAEGGVFRIEKVGAQDLTMTFGSATTTPGAAILTVDDIGNAIFAGALSAASLEIGSADTPGGITMYDASTKQPYCTQVVDGELKTVAGKCGSPEQLASAATAAQSEGAPAISIQGNNPAQISAGDVYNDLGVLVHDDKDDNLAVTTFVDGGEVSSIALNTSVAGTHTIVYRVTDNDGHTTEATRSVVVGEPAAVASQDLATSTPETAPDIEPTEPEQAPDVAVEPIPSQDVQASAATSSPAL